VRHHVAESVTVSDDAIRAAQRLLWDRLRLVAEPGGAAALAALHSGAYTPEPGERVVVVVCGSNCDPNHRDRLSGELLAVSRRRQLRRPARLHELDHVGRGSSARHCSPSV
jgi:threonine dehydratase